MTVKHEIKSQLAKLLATEDLIVEHKNVETAQFNVHTRVLLLPLWRNASNSVYDMLVGHEVGHALFTPDEDWSLELKVPQSFVNIVEDARIEKMMKRKYPGLAKSFYNGYNELNNRDFFEVEGEDLSTFNLADRANLYFKVGSFLPISFSTIEKEIVGIIEKCETFDDVKKAALVLYEYCKEEQENNEKTSTDIDVKITKPDEEKDGSFEEEFFDDGRKEKDLDELLEDSVEPEEGESYGGTAKGGQTSDIEAKTVNALEDAIKGLGGNNFVESVYFELPTLKLKDIVISNELLHDRIDIDFVGQQNDWDKSEHVYINNLYEKTDCDFIKFKKHAQREVNYMVKEFECKKSADAYARSTTARTGILNTAKLHTYKFNEDLFKKVNVVPDGKNHGLVFILDWSGSMSTVLTDTVKQLYNLLWFCKKVQIPFEVYAFTNEWKIREKDYETGAWKIVDKFEEIYEPSEGVFHIDKAFTLMNIFTSKVKNNEFEKQLRNIYRTAWTFGRQWNVKYRPSARLHLSGTPLNETLISLHKIIPQFQKENKLEKVQCVILTDGEANTIPYHTEVQRRWEYEPIMGCRGINPDFCFLRDRKLGKVYKIGYHYYDFADVLIRNLQDTFPSTNFIGIRLVETRDAMTFIKRYCNEFENPTEYAKIVSEWRKNKSFSITSSSYNSYFGMSSAVLSEDSEFEPKSDSKADIKRAFAKSLRTKKLNKKVLGEFIELVA